MFSILARSPVQPCENSQEGWQQFVRDKQPVLPTSQNHRLAEVGRDVWRSSGLTPLLKQGHLEMVAQDHAQMAFEYLQGWRLHNLTGQPVPVLSHPHGEKVFPDVQREPAVFQFVPIASCSATGNH